MAERSLLGLVGIDEATEHVYRAVLSDGTGDASGVSGRFGITVPEARRRLEELRASGLLAKQSDADGTYTAVDPRFSLHLLTDRHSDELVRIRDQVPALAALFDRAKRGVDAEPQTMLLGDPAAIASWFVRLQHQAADEFMAFDRPPYISAATNPLEPVVLDRGVNWRAVYSAASFEADGSWDELAVLTARGEKARVTAELPIKLAIADRSMALVSLTLESGRSDSLVTQSPPLVRALCELFEAYWEKATPIHAGQTLPTTAQKFARPAGRHRSATADERAILILIGAGLTDDVIARQIGISSRTLRRRTQDLMIELEAANRFQAGAEAARRGWI